MSHDIGGAREIVVVSAVFVVLLAAGLCFGAGKTLPGGDQIQYDGTYYDFRATDGKAMIKLWVPPSAKPVRGVFISGHGGGAGDSRDFARDQNMKALAARFGFGLAGLHTFPGRQAYDTGAKKFFDALNSLSAFWSAIDTNHDRIAMRQSTHAREGSKFSIVTSVDARMTVKAAHSARGLYLCFEVTDNQFMNANPAPDQYNSVDAVDVLLDSRSAHAINDPTNVTQAIDAGWGLFLTTKQYLVAFGNEKPPTVMKRIVPDPWDMDFHSVVPIADVGSQHGFQVRFAKIDALTRVQEWFIPWTEIGRPGDFAAEPAIGTRLAFAPGYNDRDAGEGSTKQLRWIDHTSPWACPAVGGKAPRGWGEIEIGPALQPRRP